MGDQDHRAGERVERLFELFDRREVEMVGRFVEHEQIGAVGHQQRQRRPRSLAWRQRSGTPVDMLGAEAELGEQRAGIRHRQSGRRGERVEQRLVAEQRRPRLLDLADDHAGTQRRRSGIRMQSSEQQRDQRGLPAAVRPDQRHPITDAEVEVDRTQPERTTLDHGVSSGRHHIAAAARRGDRQAQLPRLPEARRRPPIAQRPSGCAPPSRRVARSGSPCSGGCACRSRPTSSPSPGPASPIPAHAGRAAATPSVWRRTRRSVRGRAAAASSRSARNDSQPPENQVARCEW